MRVVGWRARARMREVKNRRRRSENERKERKEKKRNETKRNEMEKNIGGGAVEIFTDYGRLWRGVPPTLAPRLPPDDAVRANRRTMSRSAQTMAPGENPITVVTCRSYNLRDTMNNRRR